MFQFSPQIGGIKYAPGRDPAYTGLPMLQAVYEGLQDDKQNAWVKEYCQHNGVSATDLQRGFACIAAALQLAYTPQVKTPPQAIAVAGFADVPFKALVPIFVALGQRQLGAIYQAIRQTTPYDPAHNSGPPPEAVNLLEAAESAARALCGQV